jgi:hypothetical protein
MLGRAVLGVLVHAAPCCAPVQEIHQLRAAELHEAVSQGVLLLTLELPVFPHAVLYQQSLSAAAVVAQAAGAPGAAPAAAAATAPSSAAGLADVIRFQDPEVGWSEASKQVQERRRHSQQAPTVCLCCCWRQ